jgi:hypothetical protein
VQVRLTEAKGILLNPHSLYALTNLVGHKAMQFQVQVPDRSN